MTRRKHQTQSDSPAPTDVVEDYVESHTTPDDPDNEQSKEPLLAPLIAAELTSRKLRLALRHFGIEPNTIDALLVKAPGDVRYNWQKEPTVHRDSPLAEFIGATFSLSAEQLDEIFAFSGAV